MEKISPQVFNYQVGRQNNLFLYETSGYSMWPFVRAKDRLLTEKSPLQKLRVGDIILYRNNSHKLVCHRLRKKHSLNGKILLYVCGDNTKGNLRNSFELVTEEIYEGRAVALLRNGKIIDFTGYKRYLINRLIIFTLPSLRYPIKIIKYFYEVSGKPLKFCQRPLIMEILKRLLRFLRRASNLCNLSFSTVGGSAFGGNRCNHKERLFQKSLYFKLRGKHLYKNRLIHLFSRLTLDETEILRIKELLKLPLDWDYIFKKSQDERVACLIYYHLNKLGWQNCLPAKMLERFLNIYYLNAARNSLIYQEIKKMLEAFNAHKIKAILLKGIFLAENIYQNIALRPMTDIDILIKKEGLKQVNEIFNLLGYKGPKDDKLNHLGSSVTIGYSNPACRDFLIDVHLHPINSTWLLKVSKIDLKRLWLTALPMRAEGADTLSLSPEQLLLYLSQNAFTHSFDRLILYSDILESLRQHKDKINWDLVIEEAKKSNLLNILYYVLFSTSRILGAKIEELERIKPRKISLIIKNRLAFFIQKNLRFYGLPCLIYFLIEDGLWRRLKFIGKIISLLPRTTMARDLPKSPLNE